MVTHSFFFPIPPEPKKRPNKYAASHPSTRAFESAIVEMVREQWTCEPLRGRLKVEMRFADDGVAVDVYELPTNKRPNKLKGDVDNYEKAILDAMQYLVFQNDSQVDKLSGEMVSIAEGCHVTE